jgi:HAD superfamily hydrolase (TIGR01509 family)
MTPKFFYFDLGKVLVDFDAQHMCRRMAAVAGVEPEQVKGIVFDSGLQSRLERGALTSREFYDEFCRRIGARPSYQDLTAAAADIFALRPAMLPIVAQMRQAGYRLGILSNTSELHWEHCLRRYCLLGAAFDVYALSYRIGRCKPEPEIFRAAAGLAGVAPGEVFFTDDLPGHVEGARAAGFDAVLYTSTAELAATLRARGVRFNY